jgi:hypothetical protein
MTTKARSGNSEQFRFALEESLAVVETQGLRWLDVNAWRLHEQVHGSCCMQMQALFKPGDEVLSRARNGRGADLLIRYKMPRGQATAERTMADRDVRATE